jgi:hypothetical protein
MPLSSGRASTARAPRVGRVGRALALLIALVGTSPAPAGLSALYGATGGDGAMLGEQTGPGATSATLAEGALFVPMRVAPTGFEPVFQSRPRFRHISQPLRPSRLRIVATIPDPAPRARLPCPPQLGTGPRHRRPAPSPTTPPPPRNPRQAAHRRCPITGNTQPPGPRSTRLPPPRPPPGSERTIPARGRRPTAPCPRLPGCFAQCTMTFPGRPAVRPTPRRLPLKFPMRPRREEGRAWGAESSQRTSRLLDKGARRVQAAFRYDNHS